MVRSKSNENLSTILRTHKIVVAFAFVMKSFQNVWMFQTIPVHSLSIVKMAYDYCVGFDLGIPSKISKKWSEYKSDSFSIRLFLFRFLLNRIDGTPNSNCVITLIIASYSVGDRFVLAYSQIHIHICNEVILLVLLWAKNKMQLIFHFLCFFSILFGNW